MKKTILAIAVILMMAAVGIAAAEDVEVGGDVANVVPIVGPVTINSIVLENGDIPINDVDGVTFSVSCIVSDANGWDDVTGVSVVATDGTTTVSTGATLSQDGDGTVLAVADLSLLNSATPGIYTITVTATDSGAGTGTNEATANFVASTVDKFTITPLEFGQLIPGEQMTKEFTITMNYGMPGETFSISDVSIGPLDVVDGATTVGNIPESSIAEVFSTESYGVNTPATVSVTIDMPSVLKSGTLAGMGTITLDTIL